jgi:predicted transcriptional regulator
MLRVVSSGGAQKTQVMYRANLSYELLKKYLGQIVEACLVRFERNGRCYVLTSKGKRFLEKYREYARHNRRVKKQLSDVRLKREVLEQLCSTVER